MLGPEGYWIMYTQNDLESKFNNSLLHLSHSPALNRFSPGNALLPLHYCMCQLKPWDFEKFLFRTLDMYYIHDHLHH